MKCVVTSITCVGKHRQKQATQTENNHHSFYATLTSQLPIFINILSESKRSSTAGRLYRCYINSTSTNVQSIHLIRGKHSVLLCLWKAWTDIKRRPLRKKRNNLLTFFPASTSLTSTPTDKICLNRERLWECSLIKLPRQKLIVT